MSLHNLLLSTRPWSFSASFVPSVIGLILAAERKQFNRTDLFLSFFSVITVILVQAAGNLVNSYYDFINGIDRKVTCEKDGQQPKGIKGDTGDSTLTGNIVTIKQLLTLLLTCYLASFMTFIFLITSSSPSSRGILTLLYVSGLVSSYLYTGGVALKYRALGDLVILVTFGPLISEFAFVSCRGYISTSLIVISLPLAINAEAILHVNNMRDIESDREAGIFTLVMLLGKRLSSVILVILLVTPYLLCLLIAVRCCWLFLLPGFTAGIAVDIYAQVSASNFTLLPEKVAKFHLIFGTFYTIAVYFCGIGTFIGI